MNINRREINLLLGYFSDLTYGQLNELGLLSLVNRLDQFKDVPDVGEWYREVAVLLKGQKKIHAIKLVREKTGYGLKDAKDIVDNVCHEMSLHPEFSSWKEIYPQNSYPDFLEVPLSPSHLEVFDKILAEAKVLE